MFDLHIERFARLGNDLKIVGCSAFFRVKFRFYGRTVDK